MKELASTTSQLVDIRELSLRFDNVHIVIIIIRNVHIFELGPKHMEQKTKGCQRPFYLRVYVPTSY